MNFDRIKRRVLTAIEILRIKDQYLLKHDINERSLTHKLAEHLQYVIGDSLTVDCKFNKSIENPKSIKILESRLNLLRPNRENNLCDGDGEIYRVVSVYPDIIVHRRGDNLHNKLVIEVKKTSNTCGNDYDIEKLRSYTDTSFMEGLHYEWGAFIKFTTPQNHYIPPDIKWFKAGKVYTE
jgi:hypothetical protein